MKLAYNNELDLFIERSLEEDVGTGDVTSEACIDPSSQSDAYLLVKDEGVLAGVAFAKRVFQKLDPDAEIHQKIEDGQKISAGDIAFTLHANTRAILKGERLALNTMQRLSGIATLSAAFAEKVEDVDVQILDTRKTTPLMRFLEKWAVAVGGCSNYRDGLYDRVMIKDNHIDACGSITAAISSVRKYLRAQDRQLGMTVEVRSMEEVKEVLKAGGDIRMMLDNFSTSETKEAVDFIGSAMEVEASGGITLENLRSVAETGVDFISSGALTHSAMPLDLSLKIK